MRKHYVLTSVLLSFTVLSLPGLSFGQPVPVSGSCNQPLSSPSVDFKIVDGNPFAPVSTKDGCWVFVSVFRPGGNGLVVLRRTATGIERIRFIQMTDQPALMTLTPDEKTLVVATGKNVALLDVARLIEDKSDPVIGYIGDRRFSQGRNAIAVSPNGKYIFVNQASTAWVSIIDLEKALVSPDASAIIGGMPVGGFGGLGFSSDGRYLYAASGRVNDLSLVPGAMDWPLTCGDMSGSADAPRQREGVVFVIDVARAIANPASGIVGSVKAGCSPMYLTVSPDSDTFYVETSAGNTVLAFDIRHRQTQPVPSLIGTVPVGVAPTGIVTIDNGRKVVVANSDQRQHPDQLQTLTIIDASKTREGSDAVLGTIPTGASPRHMSVTGDGRTLFLTNFTSQTLQIIDLTRLTLSQDSASRASSATSCNQPMPDPLTHFNVIQGFPWQSTVSPDGCWIFVAVNRTPSGNQLANRGIAVLRRDRGKIEQRHFLKVQTTGNLTLIRNGTVLVVSAYPATLFMDVDKLTSGQSNPEISRVSDTHFLNGGIVAVTRDDRWLFAAQRDTEWLSIVDISGLSTTGAKIVGGLATGVVPGLMVLSPDEKYLYLASRVGIDPSWPAVCNASPELLTGNVKQREGAIQILDVQRAISDPSRSVVATIKAGCETRGLAVSPDGRTIFATAMLDNMVLAFDAEPLEKGLPPRLKERVAVGALPSSVVGVHGGKTIVVSNANIYTGTLQERQDRKETLTVIDGSKIASGSAVLGTIQVGASPQNLAVSFDGRTLLVNNNLGTLDVIDLDRLPLQPVKP